MSKVSQFLRWMADGASSLLHAGPSSVLVSSFIITESWLRDNSGHLSWQPKISRLSLSLERSRRRTNMSLRSWLIIRPHWWSRHRINLLSQKQDMRRYVTIAAVCLSDNRPSERCVQPSCSKSGTRCTLGKSVHHLRDICMQARTTQARCVI